MRIAMLSWESLHSIAVGGVAAHVTELAAGLGRKGHEVHVFTRRASGQRSHDRIDGVHYHRCAYPSHHDFVDDVNNMCRAFVDRLFEVEDLVGHFDIVHAHDWLAANAMIWIKQGRGRKSVLTIHATEYGRCGNCLPGGCSQRIRDQERAGTYWADRVIAVSHATKKEIASMYEVPDGKTHVVYNGVSPHRFDGEVDAGQIKRGYQIGPVDPTILFCGRLTHQKGPDLLLEAASWILKPYPQAKFVFAGDGDMRHTLEARARQLRIGPATRFLGCRNGDELVRLFKMADMVCVPSRNEPFGIVVLEAWSARKPVVVTQIGGPDEYVRHGETGLKIYPRVDSIAWGLGAVFADWDHARQMGENGRTSVEERFTWDEITEQTLTVYDPDHVRAESHRGEAKAVTVTPPATTIAPSAPKKGSAEEPVAVAGERAEGVSQLRVTVQLSLRPRRPGLFITKSRAACERVLAGSGFPVKFEEDAAQVEGDWDAVLRAVNRCYRLVDRKGDARITATMKVPGPVDELVAWEESEVLEDVRDVPVGAPLLSKHLAYVEGGE